MAETVKRHVRKGVVATSATVVSVVGLGASPALAGAEVSLPPICERVAGGNWDDATQRCVGLTTRDVPVAVEKICENALAGEVLTLASFPPQRYGWECDVPG